MKKKKQKQKTSTKEDLALYKNQEGGSKKDDDVVASLLTKLAIFGDSANALAFSFAMMLVAIAVTLWMDDEGNASMDHSTHIPPPVPPMTHSQRKPNFEPQTHDFDDLYKKLGPIPEIDPPIVFSIDANDIGDSTSMKAIREAYKKDGVVAVRGLISAELLNRLDVESRQLIEKEQQRKKDSSKHKPKQSMQFHTMYQSPAFLQPPSVVDESLAAATDGSSSSTSAVLENVKNLTSFLEVAVLSRVPQFGAALLSPELEKNETVRMIR